MPYPFNLQEKEKVVKEIKPEKALRKYYLLIWLPATFFILLFVGMFVAVFTGSGFFVSMMFFRWSFGTTLLTSLVAVVILAVVIAIILSNAAYNKRFYWITNKRIVVKRGLIGYSISSIPLERVSDLIISRSFLENLFGFASLHIQTLAGQISYHSGYKFGSEGDLIAIQEPEKTQELIFKLIKEKRKREKLSF